jgi:hypothetical protein
VPASLQSYCHLFECGSNLEDKRGDRRMASTFRTAVFSGLFFFALGSAQAAPPYTAKPKENNTRVTNPSVVSVELLGRGMMGSVYFDQALNEDLAAGFGFSVVPTNQINSSISSGRSALIFPAYLNYYFMRSAGSFFLTGGANLVGNGDYVRGTESAVGSLVFSNNGTSVIPTFGGGYENRGDNGFLFRVAAYGLVADRLAGWVGFSFGYAL